MTEGSHSWSGLIGQGAQLSRAADRRSKRIRPAITVHEMARDIAVLAETDVLVVGGGPAGTAAAVSAARLGADVILLERYNHLGGLSTGGLVVWIDRMTDWEGQHIIRGFAAEIIDLLPKGAIAGPPREIWGSKDGATASYWAQRTAAFHGIVTWSPTIDPEALKSLSMELVAKNGVRLLLHSWAAKPVTEGNVVKGVIFESKEGRQAILAKVVVDTTGDADLIGQSGASFACDVEEQDVHHCINTSFMIGGVDMERWLAFRREDKKGFADFLRLGRETLGFLEKPLVSWRNDIALFLGPRLSGYNPVDIEDLTEVEFRSRLLAIGHLEFYQRYAPGFAQAYLLLGAPQIGVRHSRRFKGIAEVTRDQWDSGVVFNDEIGVSVSLAPKFKNISIPLNSLIPRGIDGILGAGRHISCDASSHTFLREIPQCWLTGQAAGVAAAVAASSGAVPRTINIGDVQRALLAQGAYLSTAITAKCLAVEAS